LILLATVSLYENSKKERLIIKKGDRIITKSGVHARINEFDEKNTTCVIDTMAGKLKIEKSAISLELSSNLKT
jgi:preprotein translocase subunit YajC